MSSVRDSRDHLSPSIKKAMETQAEAESRKPQMWRDLASEGDQAEQNQFDATQSNKIATVMNNIHQLKIHAHRLNRSRSAQEINKYVSDDVRAETKPKTAKTKEAKDFSKSEAELVDVTDTLQHGISNVEKEMAKNPTFLQTGIDTRNTNSAMVVWCIFVCHPHLTLIPLSHSCLGTGIRGGTQNKFCHYPASSVHLASLFVS